MKFSKNNNGCLYSEELEQLLTNLSPILVEYIKHNENGMKKTLNYESPKTLMNKLNFNLSQEGCGQTEILDDIVNILKYSPSTFNPGFLSKLYASTTPIGVVSELLTAVLNGNNHIYLASPVATLAEVFLSKELGKLLGYDPNICGGVTCPGGSASNNLALLTARNIYFPYVIEHGFCLSIDLQKQLNFKPPVVFTSMSSHYSILKSASMLGIGSKNIISVPTDIYGAMDPQALEDQILQHIKLGNKPFFVNVTSGTTTMGVFDPIDKIYTICKKYDIWLHIDGSLGGDMIFLKDQKEKLMPNSGFANSFTFNPHKGLGIPLQCSFLLLRDGLNIVKNSVSLNANYLFHSSDSPNSDSPSSWDIGDSTVGCGRKPDSLKLWLAWRYYGTKGFAERVQKAINHSLYLSSLIQKSENFMLFREPVSTIVCFWYIPSAVRESVKNNATDFTRLAYPQEFADATKKICEHANFNSKISIDYASTTLSHNGSLIKIPEFFRIPFNSPLVTNSFIEEILVILENTIKTTISTPIADRDINNTLSNVAKRSDDESSKIPQESKAGWSGWKYRKHGQFW
ncbi:hypothetical protein BB561_004065 [Smittium simulii]|uniref:Uncharacterized protein n=1 Tax=Smittium simulii TaxID=133385 RepID=A0A2T9YI74_9FUNG|nr:hypothetical protein BB561_004065 [Smittium simulii]